MKESLIFLPWEEEAKKDKEIKGTGNGGATQRERRSVLPVAVQPWPREETPPPWRWGPKERAGFRKLAGGAGEWRRPHLRTPSLKDSLGGSVS